MSWRAAAAVLVVVFAIVVLQSVMAGPLLEVTGSLNATGDYSNEHFDGNQIMTDLPGSWFNMGLIGIFGVMTWAVWRVVREELTRGRI